MKNKGILKKLRESPINYFSDLFIVAMVIAWLTTLAIMTAMAIYATIAFQDTMIWSDVGLLAAVPLSAGGAIWMIKNAVQHAIANKKGTQAEMDFPKVDTDEFEFETPAEEEEAVG